MNNDNIEKVTFDLEKPKKKKKHKFLKITGILTGLIIGCVIFVLYGPLSFFREFWITSAMTTMNHQYLARILYSEKTISKVMNNNKVIEISEHTNPDLIVFEDYDSINTSYANKYEKEVLTKDSGNDLYKIINISGKSLKGYYNGYLVVVYDPSKISLASTKYLGTKGQYITDMAKESNAVVAINAGGFHDPGYMSLGGEPCGAVIQDGKIIWPSKYTCKGKTTTMIGFDDKHRLIVGKGMTPNQALQMGIRDGIQYTPVLIANGKPSFIRGNGGWGYAPRTAIAQRKDGIVLFLVINGRTINSIGADLVDVTEILTRYGAYNAANLDGGSSTALVVNNKIWNVPVAKGRDGLRTISNAWIVVE